MPAITPIAVSDGQPPSSGTAPIVMLHVPTRPDFVTLLRVRAAGVRTDATAQGEYVFGTLICAYAADASGVLTRLGVDTWVVEASSGTLATASASSSVSGSVIQISCSGVLGATIEWRVLYDGIM